MARRTAGLGERALDMAGVLLRPVLRLRLRSFRRAVRAGLYPAVRPSAPRPEADHVAWIGSSATARFGVLDEHLTTAHRVAAAVSAERGRPFDWVEVDDRVTMRQAAECPGEVVRDADAVVVAVGFTDVLLLTSPAEWRADLDRLLDHVRGAAGRPVLVAGIPPMHRFRQAPRPGRGSIRRHIARLDAATAEVVGARGDCVFVPFPEVDVEEARVGAELYSWASLHRSWSAALAPVLVELLDAD